MQCLMLITGFDYKNLEAKEIERFSVYYPDNYNDKDIKYLEEIFNKLDRCMLDSEENNKFLKKINIPPLAMCTDKFLSMEGNDFTEDDYTEFLNSWVIENAEKSGYTDNCGQASTSIAKVRNRIEIIENCLKEYAKCKEKC